jgi:hypothetical protein
MNTLCRLLAQQRCSGRCIRHPRSSSRHQRPVTVTLRGRWQTLSANTSISGAWDASYIVCASPRELPHSTMADDARHALGLVLAAATLGLIVSWLHSSTQLPAPWNRVSDVLGFTYTAAWSGAGVRTSMPVQTCTHHVLMRRTEQHRFRSLAQIDACLRYCLPSCMMVCTTSIATPHHVH